MKLLVIGADHDQAMLPRCRFDGFDYLSQRLGSSEAHDQEAELVRVGILCSQSFQGNTDVRRVCGQIHSWLDGNRTRRELLVSLLLKNGSVRSIDSQNPRI